MVRDNPALERFEIEVDGEMAFASYRRSAETVTFVHTEVPAAISGRGVGSTLAKGALEQVRARGERAVVRCSFIAGYIARHPEFQDLLAPR